MPAMPESIGKYRVIRLLGEGGMGAVYLAHDDGIDRDVAIKLLRGSEESMRRRFQTEAQSAGRLKHPNIVTVYEYGEFQGEPYLVMEYIEGETLAGLMRHDRMRTSARLSLLIQACRGLAYAHRASVIHRDVKPSNLMIDGEGVLKIVDFGIARSGSRDLTVTGKVVGTPAYMAPEQIRGDATDHRSDLFSLGLVIFEFLSGQCAFTGDSDFTIINRIVNGSPNEFTPIDASLGPSIKPILEKCLAGEPSKRYQSADAIAEDLERVRSNFANEDARVSMHDAATVLLPASGHDAKPRRKLAAVAGGLVAVAAAAMIAVRWPGALDRPKAADTAAPAQPQTALPSPPIPRHADAVVEKKPATSETPAPAANRVVMKPAIETARRPPADGNGTAMLLSAATAALSAADYDTAIAKFTQVLAADPSNATATSGVAEARRALDRVRAANVKSRLAEAEQKLSDGAYDEAITIFDAILKIDAANPEALDGAMRAKRAKAAEETIVKGRAKKPSGQR